MTRIKSFWLAVVLILATLIFLTTWLINPLLKNLLATQVKNKLVGNFYYDYEHLEVDLVQRSVTFENVNWKFPKDTSIFNQSGFVKQFKLEGISILSFVGGSGVRIKNIMFDSLILSTRIERFSKKDSLPDENFDFYSLIKGQIPGLKVNTIQIRNGNATWLDPTNKKVWGKINKVQLFVDSFSLDSTTTAENNGWFSFQNVLLEGVNGELYLADSLHKIQTAKIQLDYENHSVVIDSLKIIPLFAKSQMRYVRRYESDRIEMSIPRIAITGIEMKRIMVKNELRIGRVLIDGPTIAVFRDMTSPADPNHFPLLPQLALRHAKLNMNIDLVSVRNAFIEYEQLGKKTQRAGKVFFSHLHAELSNITNDSAGYQHNTHSTLQASAQFMGVSKLTVRVVFNLVDPNGNHWISGKLGKLDLTAMNNVLGPLAAVSIRSGLLDHLNFKVKLNDEVSDGEVTFLYRNLKLDKLNENDLDDQDVDNSIISLLANTFVIKKSNPSGDRDSRIGTVHFKRIKERSIFNFWLKSVLDGMKATVLNQKENNEKDKAQVITGGS